MVAVRLPRFACVKLRSTSTPSRGCLCEEAEEKAAVVRVNSLLVPLLAPLSKKPIFSLTFVVPVVQEVWLVT